MDKENMDKEENEIPIKMIARKILYETIKDDNDEMERYTKYQSIKFAKQDLVGLCPELKLRTQNYINFISKLLKTYNGLLISELRHEMDKNKSTTPNILLKQISGDKIKMGDFLLS